MKDMQWTFMPKTDWKRGPWDGEPDKAQWTDPETKLPCLILRNSFGAWCGYVGVSEGHPAFGKDYDAVHSMSDDVSVHGGLTFAGKCQKQEHGICHVVEPGEDDNTWWLGFDCAHCDDLSPKMVADMERFSGLPAPNPHFMRDMQYRDLNYVKQEVTDLAKQLAAMPCQGRHCS